MRATNKRATNKHIQSQPRTCSTNNNVGDIPTSSKSSSGCSTHDINKLMGRQRAIHMEGEGDKSRNGGQRSQGEEGKEVKVWGARSRGRGGQRSQGRGARVN